MKKKGFTLIEIIVCIVIISLIAVGSFVGIKIIQNKDNDKINEIILNAASVYSETNKDKYGLTILNAVTDYAKGVKIPLTTLVDEGYLEQKYVDEIEEKYTKSSSNESFYVLLAEVNNYCESGAEFILSWTMIEDTPIFLCDTKAKIEKDDITKILNHNPSLDKYAVSDSFNSEEDNDKIVKGENGIYHYCNEETKKTFNYYRGSVNNNYVKLGKDADGNDLYWRIIWYNSDKKMKLVLDEVVPIYFTNVDGEKILATETNKILKKIYDDTSGSGKRYCFTGGSIIDNGFSYYNPRYNYTIQKRQLYDGCPDTTQSIYNSDNYYYKQLKGWYDSTNLNEFNFITKTNNFCESDAKQRGQSFYLPSKNFECIDGIMDDAKDFTYISGNVSSPVGYISYGDAVMVGLKNDARYGSSSSYTVLNSSLTKEDNYLIEPGQSIILSDYTFGGTYRRYFYYDEKGLHNDYLGSKSELYQGKILFLDENGVTIDTIFHDYDTYIINSNFLGTALKPTIVLDMSNHKLSNNTGIKTDTKDDSYTIIDK